MKIENAKISKYCKNSKGKKRVISVFKFIEVTYKLYEDTMNGKNTSLIS